jgi:diguanylate cyclase (GGDEF)-like protein
MRTHYDKAMPPPQYLLSALDQSEQVKQTIEDCVEKLSSVTAVLNEEITDHLPPETIARALNQSKEVASKVQECVEDLSSVNMALAREISERKDLEAELFKSKLEQQKANHLAFHDAVTGLPNRTLFNDRLDNALAQAQRHGRRVILLFIDLDNFKNINDQYGHAIGDEVLRTVADRLKASIRTEDTACRHGGDEFLCLLLEVRDELDVTTIIEKIIRNVSKPCVIGGIQLSVMPSVGIAVYPADGTSATTLVNNADIAMYKAKQNNKIKKHDMRGYWFYSKIGMP